MRFTFTKKECDLNQFSHINSSLNFCRVKNVPKSLSARSQKVFGDRQCRLCASKNKCRKTFAQWGTGEYAAPWYGAASLMQAINDSNDTM